MKTLHRTVVGAFIFSDDNHILLGKSHAGGVYQGVWSVPGGGIEAGETAEQAMRRETWEEVGLDISPATVTALTDTQQGQSEKTIDGEVVLVTMEFFDFLVQFAAPAAEIAFERHEEFSEASWLPLDSLTAGMLSPGVAQRLRKLGYLQ